MKIVWSLGEATGRQVYEALRERRPVAYTTVMTMLRVLETKGHVTKRRANGGRRAAAAPTSRTRCEGRQRTAGAASSGTRRPR